MNSSLVGTYLRFLRRKSGMRQKDLARLLGGVTEDQISRHERSISTPSLQTAFAYEVIFRRPVSEIFPGLFYAVQSDVEKCLSEFETVLENSDAKGAAANAVARRLEWLWSRQNSESV